MNNKGFDLWATSYDQTVQVSNQNEEYPFAGYDEMMDVLFEKANRLSSSKILDVGIGTANLAHKLYNEKHQICGIDFSQNMLEIAKEKMPFAKLYLADLSNGMPSQLQDEKFDTIMSNYALHHFENTTKIKIIKKLLCLLKPEGELLIADISFDTELAQQKCKERNIHHWDDDEYYFIVTKLLPVVSNFAHVQYKKYSQCGGIWTIKNKG